jgi:hypothetical protein
MSTKTFTLEEANTLLPVLESLLKSAMESKQLMEDADQEFQDLAHRIFLNGGTLVNVVYIARRKAEREKAIQRLKDTVAEIHATGVQVKDLDVGLLDFPCKAAAETVLLCWKFGEEKKIKHWHGLEEGFQGRKPIETLSFESKKRSNPERPH